MSAPNHDPEGLTSVEADGLLARFGPNEPAAPHHAKGLLHFLSLLANPLVLVLLIAASVSAVVGDFASSIIIIVVVLIGSGINFIQTYRSHRAVEKLRKGVALTATVRRDGEWVELPRNRIVPGDIIRLSAGDLVPADARLLSARDLHVQQAALTGESLPTEKEAGGPSGGSAKADDRNMVFLGTSVVSGTATAVVTATGKATAFGNIAAGLELSPPETEFERGTRRFGLFITQTVMLLVFFVFLAGALLHRDPLQSLLFAVALAVGLTPEFLPMITAVTLAQGAVRMARRHVIVKHLPAMQNFGSMDVICCDKTGTLTRGEMELAESTDFSGNASDRVFLLAYLTSHHETGIRSPLDAAILKRPAPDIHAYQKRDEIPFDFERRRMSIVVEDSGGGLLITKGAPESVLAHCTQFEDAGRVRPLDDESRHQIQATYEKLSEEGKRVVAVAFRHVPAGGTFTVADERDLTYAGFIDFLDPPREDAAEAIRSLHRDGVRIMVLSGDNERVVQHVCGLIGIDSKRVVRGEEIDRLSDSALFHVAEHTHAFARLSPGQKTRIILALKRRGHVVGFLGDGINDAPSLHAADVGISVAGATDVARAAADIILMEPGLGVLHGGIREGRHAFGNVMKYLLMGTSSNFGNMFSMAAATVFLPFLPMLPVQILLNNLLYDLAQLTIPTDRVDASYLHKPRRWDIGLIRRFMLVIGPISSLFDFLTFAVLLGIFHASEALFHTGWFVESLATQTLVLFVIRTGGNPFRSRPSRALTITVLAVAVGAVILPYSLLADPLGFVPLPIGYLFFLVGATALYLALVEVIKRWVLRRALR